MAAADTAAPAASIAFAPPGPSVTVTVAPCEGCAIIRWAPALDAVRTVVLRSKAPSGGSFYIIADVLSGPEPITVYDTSGRAIVGVAAYYLDDYDANNILIRRSGPYPVRLAVFLPVMRYAPE